jgi:outer membrane murein-binding lipoprotein Lpp
MMLQTSTVESAISRWRLVQKKEAGQMQAEHRRLTLLTAVLMSALLAGCQSPEQKREEAAQPVREQAAPHKDSEAKPVEVPQAPGAAAAPAKPELEKKAEAGAAGTAPGKPKPDTKKGWQKDLVRDLKNYPNKLGEDTVALVAKDNLLENAAAIGAGLSLAIVSKSTSWDKNVAHTFDHYERFGAATNVANVLGNPGTHFGFAALSYAYGEAYKDQEAADLGRRLFEALAINDLLTLGLQVATNQERPNGRQKMGFPSGHTSSSFALAAVLDGIYGPLVGIPMYGLAGFVGAARLDSNKHHLSDVLMGAALGYVVGRTVTKTDRKREVLGFQLDPWIEDESGAGGVQLRKRF